jgi:hypothetical protein
MLLQNGESVPPQMARRLQSRGDRSRTPKTDVTSTFSQTTEPRRGHARLKLALSVVIFVAALGLLYSQVRDINVTKFAEALQSQSPWRIALAGGIVVCGYVTLTFYDVFALRTIGRSKIPYAAAALASFASFTIGHSVGAAVVTGGLIRLRVYGVFGLTLADITKIAVVTSMTFWLGNALLLGGAVIYAPDAAGALDQLPSWVNRLIGIAGPISILGYLAWLAPRPRAIGRSGWRLVLPDPKRTVLQAAIGATDLILIATAMYVCLPSVPEVEYSTVLVIFLAAAFFGTVSHAPGGLGVIEATMLLGLTQFAKEDLLASLLTFRLIYFIVPTLLASCALGVRELQLLARRKARKAGVSAAEQ